MAKRIEEPTFTLSMTGRHVSISDAMREYAEKKIGKLHRYFERDMEAHIIVINEKRRQVVEVVITAHGEKLTGTSKAIDVYTAIDEVVEKLEKQLIKLKGKFKEKKRRASKEKLKAKEKSFPSIAEDFEEDEEKIEKTSIKKIEEISSKPMSPDEAAMEMEIDKSAFMVFVNAQTEEVNVIYRMKNGKIALVTRG
jgi:putative sigma-54 modulation protein